MSGLGELLWDMLPGGKQLGGTTANFAMMSARLGNRGVIASRIGRDALGDEARDYLAPLPADLSYLQTDDEHATGSVSVTFQHGEPEYVIHQPVAWDFFCLDTGVAGAGATHRCNQFRHAGAEE